MKELVQGRRETIEDRLGHFGLVRNERLRQMAHGLLGGLEAGVRRSELVPQCISDLSDLVLGVP